MNTVIDLIKQRVSYPKLTGNAPSGQQLQEILACAMRAPDHARLKPWHFHVVQGSARDVLGELFEESAKESGVELVDKLLRYRNMPMRAPMIIVATCEPVTNQRYLAKEQILAVGGCNFKICKLRISSLEYGSIWRTGEYGRSRA